MSRPLSPLSSSDWNARDRSLDSSPSPARRRKIDEIIARDDDDMENLPPNPAKRPVYDIIVEDGSNTGSLVIDEMHCTGIGDENDDITPNPPSSPFQYDARNDTVDLEKLRTGSLSSGSMNGSCTPNVLRDSVSGEADSLPPIQLLDVPEQETLEHRPDFIQEGREQPQIDGDHGDSVIHHQHFGESAQCEIGNSIMEERHNEEMSTVCQDDSLANDHDHMDSDVGNDAMICGTGDPMDDTCLSTFSAVPNADMTLFAKLGGSPTKRIHDMTRSLENTSNYLSRQNAEPVTPKTARRGHHANELLDVNWPTVSPTSRKQNFGHDNDVTDLLDLTDQLNYLTRVSQRYAAQNGRISSPRRRPPLKSSGESIRTPGKFALLDFDIPPAPTPRSIPTITPRELESLKSGFLSELSSLKATLSGKEAEVASLKQAVADAERRVGEASEEVRNEAARREALEIEQAAWERRGKEVESILRGVKAEILERDREREQHTKKFEETERRREQLESRVVELESQLSASRKAAATAEATSSGNDSCHTKTAEEAAREVQDAVERVARELHALYRGKHESKVAALKKSYEARWEKRVREAEHKMKEAIEENERLKTERDATISGPVNPNMSMLGRDNETHEAEKRVLEAQIKGLQQEMAVVKRNNEKLHSELKMERTEKGELVAAVDEWLAMQQIQNQSRRCEPLEPPGSDPSCEQQETVTKNLEASIPPESENLSRSVIGRGGPSGIRPPSGGIPAGEKKSSRASMYGGHARTNSTGRSGIAAPTPGRSGIMNSIERMGRGSN
ncbi:hypothetical protein Egran_04481 [Elaphomyces granulatus]|uniref:Uncharacterized protein n=1 Tax=Elaphomyces granulatus TaxID=519963 RepID=A0A232LUJ1_9EURO|nr:hypothetical protein Egran_04481 [Elaphomyces granulatus]